MFTYFAADFEDELDPDDIVFIGSPTRIGRPMTYFGPPHLCCLDRQIFA
jgi:hypothetical protein